MAYSREIEKLERQFAENPRRFAAPFADALRKSDEVARALEVIRVGLELNPEYIPGSVILGRCHLDLGDDDGAEVAFSRVLDLDNENVIALKSLADILERQGRKDEAVRFLTYLLDVDRSNDEAREQLARIQASPAVAASSAAPPAVPAAVPPMAGVPEPGALPDLVFGAPPGEGPPVPASGTDEFLEPTALWEPPVGVTEAVISTWVEPTAMEPTDLPESGESLVEEPTDAGEFVPLEGLEAAEFRAATESASYEEFFLEREEEIILTSLSGAEYQVANDSETLLGSGAVAPPPEEVPAAAAPAASPPEKTPAFAAGKERPTAPAAATPSSVIAEELRAPAAEAEAPAAPMEAAAEAAVAVESTAAVLMVTESMAELYAVQGHPGEALGVYRILYDRNPGNERLRQRIQELEAAEAAQVAADAAPSYAASVTGGRAVASFLGALLQSRPVPVDLPEPPPAPEMASAARAPEGGEEAVASGAPTRPAGDRLSLGAIFGEDPSPVHPAEATVAGAKAEGSGGFSFDEFFGGADATPTGRTSSGSVRAVRASDDEDDLDQFHVWLQSLKR